MEDYLFRGLFVFANLLKILDGYTGCIEIARRDVPLVLELTNYGYQKHHVNTVSFLFFPNLAYC